MSNYPLGANEDSRAPWNEDDNILLCSNCYEQVYEAEERDPITCEECGEDAFAITESDYDEMCIDDRREDLLETLAEDNWLD